MDYNDRLRARKAKAILAKRVLSSIEVDDETRQALTRMAQTDAPSADASPLHPFKVGSRVSCSIQGGSVPFGTLGVVTGLDGLQQVIVRWEGGWGLQHVFHANLLEVRPKAPAPPPPFKPGDRVCWGANRAYLGVIADRVDDLRGMDCWVRWDSGALTREDFSFLRPALDPAPAPAPAPAAPSFKPGDRVCWGANPALRGTILEDVKDLRGADCWVLWDKDASRPDAPVPPLRGREFYRTLRPEPSSPSLSPRLPETPSMSAMPRPIFHQGELLGHVHALEGGVALYAAAFTFGPVWYCEKGKYPSLQVKSLCAVWPWATDLESELSGVAYSFTSATGPADGQRFAAKVEEVVKREYADFKKRQHDEPPAPLTTQEPAVPVVKTTPKSTLDIAKESLLHGVQVAGVDEASNLVIEAGSTVLGPEIVAMLSVVPAGRALIKGVGALTLSYTAELGLLPGVDPSLVQAGAALQLEAVSRDLVQPQLAKLTEMALRLATISKKTAPVARLSAVSSEHEDELEADVRRASPKVVR